MREVEYQKYFSGSFSLSVLIHGLSHLECSRYTMCLTVSLLSEENDCICAFFSFLFIYVKFTKNYVDFDVAMK